LEGDLAASVHQLTDYMQARQHLGIMTVSGRRCGASAMLCRFSSESYESCSSTSYKTPCNEREKSVALPY